MSRSTLSTLLRRPFGKIFKILLVLILFPIIILSTARIVRAGGWAVITLDEVPREFEVNSPARIKFRVLQHGRTAVAGLSPQVAANLPGSSEAIQVVAADLDELGHYQAELTFPESGNWQWSISAFNRTQMMPPITVIEPTGAPFATAVSTTWPYAVGLVLIAISGFLIVRSPGRAVIRGGALGVVILVVVSGGAYAGNRSNITDPDDKSESGLAPLVDRGAAVFIGKGCATCHTHVEIAFPSLAIGPELSTYSAERGFLKMWLENPVSVRPKTGMPDLDLTDEEIELLIFFLNRE